MREKEKRYSKDMAKATSTQRQGMRQNAKKIMKNGGFDIRGVYSQDYFKSGRES